MTANAVISDVLLVAAVAVVALSCLGVALMPDVYQKVHFLGPVGVAAPALVALAVTFAEGWSEQATQTWLAALFLMAAGPVLGHATARAARVREAGDWRLEEPGSSPRGGRR